MTRRLFRMLHRPSVAARWPQKIGEAIDAIEQAPFLTEDQKRDILRHNAVRFLRLEEDASGARPSKEE